MRAWLRSWTTLITQRAIDNMAYVAPCNHVGVEGECLLSWGQLCGWILVVGVVQMAQ
jgi:predicted amidohydrolase